jgi:hypothetical protein
MVFPILRDCLILNSFFIGIVASKREFKNYKEITMKVIAISSPAGSGKTWFIKNYLKGLPFKTLFLTTTRNSASQYPKEMRVQTINKAIGWNGEDKEGKDGEIIHSWSMAELYSIPTKKQRVAEIIVIDEAFFWSQQAIGEVIRIYNKALALILIGDPKQFLPIPDDKERNIPDPIRMADKHYFLDCQHRMDYNLYSFTNKIRDGIIDIKILKSLFKKVDKRRHLLAYTNKEILEWNKVENWDCTIPGTLLKAHRTKREYTDGGRPYNKRCPSKKEWLDKTIYKVKNSDGYIWILQGPSNEEITVTYIDIKDYFQIGQGLTFHSVQGSTIDDGLTINVGGWLDLNVSPDTFSRALYVALTRCKSLNDICITDISTGRGIPQRTVEESIIAICNNICPIFSRLPEYDYRATTQEDLYNVLLKYLRELKEEWDQEKSGDVTSTLSNPGVSLISITQSSYRHPEFFLKVKDLNSLREALGLDILSIPTIRKLRNIGYNEMEIVDYIKQTGKSKKLELPCQTDRMYSALKRVVKESGISEPSTNNTDYSFWEKNLQYFTKTEKGSYYNPSGNYVCKNPLKNHLGSYYHTNEDIISLNNFVFEFDDIKIDEKIYPISFDKQWLLWEKNRGKVHSVVFSGNESLHFWIRINNGPTTVEEYHKIVEYINKNWFEGLACPSMRAPTQLMRAPGRERENGIKQLLVINEMNTIEFDYSLIKEPEIIKPTVTYYKSYVSPSPEWHDKVNANALSFMNGDQSKGRHSRLRSAVPSWIIHGWTLDEIMVVLVPYNSNSKDQKDFCSYGQKIYNEWVRKNGQYL